MPNCPICNTSNTEQSPTCVTCGFDLSPYPLSLGIPQPYIELEQIKLEWSRHLWEQFQEKDNLFQKEYTNLLQSQTNLQKLFEWINSENTHIKERIAQLETQLEQIQEQNLKPQEPINIKSPISKESLPETVYSTWQQTKEQNQPAPNIQQEKYKRRLKHVSPIHGLSGHAFKIRALTISSDSQILVSGGDDKTIKIWDMNHGGLRRTLYQYPHRHTEAVRALTISPDGKTIVSGSDDKTIKIWDKQTGKLKQTLTKHTSGVYALAISPDGKTLVSGSVDKTLS